jgi:hypothetical protein
MMITEDRETAIPKIQKTINGQSQYTFFLQPMLQPEKSMLRLILTCRANIEPMHLVVHLSPSRAP